MVYSTVKLYFAYTIVDSDAVFCLALTVTVYFAYTIVLSGGVLYLSHCGQWSCILLMTFWTLKEYFTIMSSQDVFYYLIVAMNVYLTGN